MQCSTRPRWTVADAPIFPGKHLKPIAAGQQSINTVPCIDTSDVKHNSAQNKRTQADVADLEMIGKVLPGAAQLHGGPRLRRRRRRVCLFSQALSVVSLVTLILDNRCVIIAALSFFSDIRPMFQPSASLDPPTTTVPRHFSLQSRLALFRVLDSSLSSYLHARASMVVAARCDNEPKP